MTAKKSADTAKTTTAAAKTAAEKPAVDTILDRELKAQAQSLIAQAASDPAALARYREVYKHWEEVKARLSAQRAEE